MGSKYRKIRVSNGVRTILELIKNQPFRCIFVGEMPIYLNGGRVPTVLDLVLIPQPGSQSPPNIANILCQCQSTQFKFCVDKNQLKYVDLTGGIPSGKQNWCRVRATPIRGPLPSQFDPDNIVEICGIPTIHVFVSFIDVSQDFLNRYASLREGQTYLIPKNQIKKLRIVIEPLSKNVPQNVDQACAALASSKQLLAILCLLPTSIQVQQLTILLRAISIKIENWVHTHQRIINDDQVIQRTDRGTIQVSSPVTQEVDKGPEPSVVGEDRDESDDWVAITMPTGVFKDNSYYCEDQADSEASDFELLSIE